MGHEEDGYCISDVQEKLEQRVKDYIKKGLTPDFEKDFKKQRPYWDAYVQYKSSEDSEQRTTQAKENASKKKHFHHLGQGAYKASIPKWHKMEEDLKESYR